MTEEEHAPEPVIDSAASENDVYGPASFPASDPPSSWWGGVGDTTRTV
jgi:hypothetical protein